MLHEYLDNNLSITTNNDDIFMIKIILDCGAINETKGIMGYSHLLEHVKFNKFKSNDVNIESGLINAYTSKDQTAYYVKCTEDRMKYAVELCVNIVFNTEFSDNRLQNEKKIVYEEMYMTRSNDFLYNTLLETIMNKRNNNYTNKIIGRKTDLRKATNDSLKKYNDFFYCLKNAKIICSCANKNKSLLRKTLLKMLTKYKAPLEPPTLKPLYNTNLDECDFKRFDYSMIVHSNPFSETNAVYLIFKTFEGSSVKHLYLHLIMYILSNNNKNSLLFKSLREKQGVVYNIKSSLDIYKHFGIYCIGFNTSENNIQSIMVDVFQIMNDYLFTKKKMTLKKFEKYKRMYLNHFKYMMSTSDNAFQFITTFSYLNEHFSIEKYIQMIEGFSLDSFVKFCNEALNLNKLGCYIISKKLSQKEYANAFKNVLQKFKNEVH